MAARHREFGGAQLTLLGDLKMYARFSGGLPSFLRNRLNPEDAEAIVRQRLATREETFLSIVEKGILGSPKSPYPHLFELAQCTMDDLRESVHRQGLEATLEDLRQAGVYVTFEELKGHQPIVRDGVEIAVEPHDFDNPFTHHHYAIESGGSTGAGTRVGVDLDYLVSRGPQNYLFEKVHDLYGAPTAFYYGALPDHGLNSLLTRQNYGSIPQRWFTPALDSHARLAIEYRIANALLPRLVRLAGRPVPLPEPVSLDETHIIARWMVDSLAEHGRCVLRTHVSKAVRVCLAAKERGWRLDNAAITLGAEPPTPAKMKVIRDTGARPIPGYHMSELGPIAFACARPVDDNDVHLLRDHLAVIQAQRRVPGFDLEVSAFLFTTLLPTAPKLLVNFEGDDYGTLEERSCGCPWEQFGMTLHLRNIRSYRKLTGEGMTLVGSELERILDEVLPKRFGGSPLEYQMVEEEDTEGMTRLTLVVDPKVPLADETAVIDCILEEIGQLEGYQGMAGAIWKQADTLRIRREAPQWSQRGKLNPLQIDQSLRRGKSQEVGHEV